MLNGIYSVTFSSSRDNGSGVVVFIDGKVYGGDAGYFYKGDVTVNNQSATSRIHVKQHNTGVDSIFGRLSEFDLDLSGNAGQDSFSLTGGIVGQPGMVIKITGKKVADI